MKKKRQQNLQFYFSNILVHKFLSKMIWYSKPFHISHFLNYTDPSPEFFYIHGDFEQRTDRDLLKTVLSSLKDHAKDLD